MVYTLQVHPVTGEHDFLGWLPALISLWPFFWIIEPVAFFGGALPNFLFLLGSVFMLARRFWSAALCGVIASAGATNYHTCNGLECEV